VLIRDPIHGDIRLHAHEAGVLDTPEMQRLRGIKQLGTAYLVYPGAHHTRFEHVLGTLHAASRICSALRANGHPVTEDDERIIRLAALVHDVSHIPFGHTFEDERKVFPRHDRADRLRAFLYGGELGELLAHLGVRDEVFALLTEERSWRSDIVAGAVDADLLDYLRRDAYFCGLAQTYDDRVYTYFSVADGRLVLRLERHGMERPDARSEILHLLRMRYVLTERVYFHHAKVIAGAMISKAVEIAVTRGLTQERLYPLTDATLLQMLATEWGDDCAELARAVQERRLFKRAFGISAATVSEVERYELAEAYHRPGPRRDAVEDRIAREAGLGPHQVILYVPPPTTFKEISMLAVTPSGIMPLSRAATSRLEISALEEQYRNLWRLWVFAPASHREAVAEASERVLGLPSELQQGTPMAGELR